METEDTAEDTAEDTTADIGDITETTTTIVEDMEVDEGITRDTTTEAIITITTQTQKKQKNLRTTDAQVVRPYIKYPRFAQTQAQWLSMKTN